MSRTKQQQSRWKQMMTSSTNWKCKKNQQRWRLNGRERSGGIHRPCVSAIIHDSPNSECKTAPRRTVFSRHLPYKRPNAELPDALALLHTSQPADSPKDSSHSPNLFLSSIKLRPFPPNHFPKPKFPPTPRTEQDKNRLFNGRILQKTNKKD